ncbi:hypothetical protein Ancab_019221 [Ancistrocladus abbreviatus]
MLEGQLVGINEQPLHVMNELKKAYCGLVRLGKGPSAHKLLLKRYGSQLQKSIAAFLPSCSLYPKTFSATLSKIVFSAISSVAKECGSTFGDNPIFTNKVIQWAEQEVKSSARLVKENGPPYPSIIALHAAGICVEGLKFSKLLMVLLWPYMEEVLEMNFRRAKRVALELVENDDDLLLSPRFLGSLSVFVISFDRILIDSQTRFMFIVQLFDKYANLLIKVLPSPLEGDNLAELREDLPFISETDSQQLALLGVSYTIEDELLSTIVSRIWTLQNEIREPRSGLTKSIVPIADIGKWKKLQALEDEWFANAVKDAISKLLQCASGSEASKTEDEHLIDHDDLALDSDDTISYLSTVELFHSFVSAEMGDSESLAYLSDPEG